MTGGFQNWRQTAAVLLSVAAISGCPDDKKPAPAAEKIATQPAEPPVTETSSVVSWSEVRTASVAWTYLEANEGRCAWKVRVPDTEPRTISEHPGSCGGGGYALSADGTRGAWWVEGEPEHLRLITFEPREVQRLALPKTGELNDIGFAGNRLVALMAHIEGTGLKVNNDHEPPLAYFEGETHELGFDGVQGLVVVFEAGPRGWRRIEVEPTSFDWDLAAGVDAAPISRRLGPRSRDIIWGRHLNWEDVAAQDRVAPMLHKIRKPKDGATWLRAGPPPYLYGYAGDAELVSVQTPVFVSSASGQPRPLLSLRMPPGQSVRLQWRDPLLVVRGTDQTFVINARNDRLVASRAQGESLILWPKTRPTP